MLPTSHVANASPSSPVADPTVRPPDDIPHGSASGASGHGKPDVSKETNSHASYLSALRGASGPQQSPSQPWISVGVSDIGASCSNGIKALSLSQGFKDKLCKPWSHSVVVLASLGNLVGRTVKIDFNTQTVERGKFARIAVEINLDDPLPPVVLLDGAFQQVEYENLPNLCFECGRVGHEKLSCPSRPTLASPVQGLLGPTTAETVVASNPPPAADSYGPWMIVARQSRRPVKESLTKKERNPSHGERNQIKEGELPESSSKIPVENTAVVEVGGANPKIKEVDVDFALSFHNDKDPIKEGGEVTQAPLGKTARKRKNKSKKSKPTVSVDPTQGPHVASSSGLDKAGGPPLDPKGQDKDKAKPKDNQSLFEGLIPVSIPDASAESLSNIPISRFKATVPKKDKKRKDKLKQSAIVARNSDSGLSKKRTKARVLEEVRNMEEQKAAKGVPQAKSDESSTEPAVTGASTGMEATPMALDPSLEVPDPTMSQTVENTSMPLESDEANGLDLNWPTTC
ncbi:hypothetical protein LINPERHAP2_LOCUS1516 [Linum perenne]